MFIKIEIVTKTSPIVLSAIFLLLSLLIWLLAHLVPLLQVSISYIDNIIEFLWQLLLRLLLCLNLSLLLLETARLIELLASHGVGRSMLRRWDHISKRALICRGKSALMRDLPHTLDHHLNAVRHHCLSFNFLLIRRFFFYF